MFDEQPKAKPKAKPPKPAGALSPGTRISTEGVHLGIVTTLMWNEHRGKWVYGVKLPGGATSYITVPESHNKAPAPAPPRLEASSRPLRRKPRRRPKDFVTPPPTIPSPVEPDLATAADHRKYLRFEDVYPKGSEKKFDP